VQKQEERKQGAPRQKQFQKDIGANLDAESTQWLQQVEDDFHGDSRLSYGSKCGGPKFSQPLNIRRTGCREIDTIFNPFGYSGNPTSRRGRGASPLTVSAHVFRERTPLMLVNASPY
jgi:hypothetical protein